MESPAFSGLGIDARVLAVLDERGYTTATAVQAALLQADVAGRDVLVSAQTGSGKTVAFGLLIAPGLVRQERAPQTRSKGKLASPYVCAPQALVIAPTRELASQVRNELLWLLAPLGLRVGVVTGGTSVGGELRELAMGCEVLVGTPGRLNDHLGRSAIDPSKIATVVLDEADEMLDMGFREELEAILQLLPSERRTVMLSATLPDSIVTLARRYQRDPVRLTLDPQGSANANIQHIVHLVPHSMARDALINVLLAAPEERTLVFVRQRAEAGEVAAALNDQGFTAACLSGEMAQRDRTNTLDAFRAGRVHQLVATDVAARGLDVPEVTRVVHMDLPHDAEGLIHRAGRTGRAGRKGTSILILPPAARNKAQYLLRVAGARPLWQPVPSSSELREAAEARLRARLLAPPDPEAVARQTAFATGLVETGDPVAIVAALLAEIRWEGPCAPRSIPVFTERPRREPGQTPYQSSYQGSGRERPRGGGKDGERERLVVFRVNFGRRHGATPQRLLAMICRRGGVRGSDIGAIRIDGDASTFGVAYSVATPFMRASTRPDRRDPQVRIERVHAPSSSSAASHPSP